MFTITFDRNPTIMKTNFTVTDPARLNELYDYRILNTPPEKEFDEIVELASLIAGTPVSLISLVDKDRQWFKAAVGVNITETPVDASFCAHAIAADETSFIIPDATKDERFMNNQLVVNDPNIRFYAGFPLVTGAGQKLGTLCVIDSRPRTLNAQQENALRKLSNQAMKLIELHRKNQQLQNLREAESHQKEALTRLLDNQRKIIAILGHDTRGPLHSMQQMLKLFSQGLIPPSDVAGFYQMMMEQNEATINMIGGLVKWGEIHLHSGSCPQPAVALGAIVKEVFTQYELAAEAKTVALQHGVIEDVPIRANSEMVSFIVRNLVNNAVKYTDNGCVNVRGRRRGSRYELTVSDTGRGMSEGTQQALFKGKVSSTKGTHQEKGSGLGLMLINDFIQQAGGEIRVKSRLNKGTSIRVGIPCA